MCSRLSAELAMLFQNDKRMCEHDSQPTNQPNISQPRQREVVLMQFKYSGETLDMHSFS